MTYCIVEKKSSFLILQLYQMIPSTEVRWKKYAKYGNHARPESCEDYMEKFEADLKLHFKVSQCDISH